RTAVASGGDLLVRFARLAPRFVCGDANERIEARIVGIDALEALVSDLRRRDLTRAQAPGKLFYGHHPPPQLAAGPEARAPAVATSARSLKSAARSAAVARASVSRRDLRSGRPRCSASAIAAFSHASIVMVSSPKWRHRRATARSTSAGSGVRRPARC